MKWEIASSTGTQEIYELWHHEKKLLTLDFHPATNSARIKYAGEKRVFLIRKEGFLRSKTVLCNEYGIRLGHLVHENKENFVELNHEKFFYTIHDNPTTELIIYKESIDNPLVICGLNVNNSSAPVRITKEKNLPVNSHSSLILALCWYMFQPVAEETRLEYA
jgi:hypothetical protein